MSAGIGMGANIVGSELQGWASLLDKWAMADAYKQQAAQQGQYRSQAMQLFNPSAFGTGAMQEGVAQGAAARRAGYNTLASTPLAVSMPGAATAPQDKAYLDLIGSARANLGGYNDWAVQQAIKNLQTENSLNQITNFAKGTSSIFPLQMYAAQHSMDDLSAAGQAISSLGGAASNFGQLYGSTPPSQNAPTYYPMGQTYGGYPMFGGYTDAYGNQWPTGYNVMPTGATPG